MDELKEKLAAIGIEDDKIDETLEAFMTFLKTKVPDSMEGMLESLVKGDGHQIGGDALDKVKGFFGS